MIKQQRIGRRWCILPPQTGVPEGSIPLFMVPGAFGSGEHETTASCLELLETLGNLKGVRVLDFGSGTGILAVSALRLGASEALCVDIEPKAIETCRKNAALNGLADRIRHHCGYLGETPACSYDLILANIYGDILLDQAEELIERCAPGARLLLSGILYEYNYDVRARFERLGCEVLRNRMLEDYSTVLLRKG